MALTERNQLERYSFVAFRNMLINAVNEFGYTELSRTSGVARSTLYRIVSGEIIDVKLSTAHQIKIGIIISKNNKKNS